MYRKAKAGKIELHWQCDDCLDQCFPSDAVVTTTAGSSVDLHEANAIEEQLSCMALGPLSAEPPNPNESSASIASIGLPIGPPDASSTLTDAEPHQLNASSSSSASRSIGLQTSNRDDEEDEELVASSNDANETLSSSLPSSPPEASSTLRIAEPPQLNASSFVIADIAIESHEPVAEDSLNAGDEVVPHDYVPPVPESDVRYSKIEDGTKRGNPKLVDSLGYSYVIKRR